eukprot:12457918-Ditylum_brightwellii.AAC.1
MFGYVIQAFVEVRHGLISTCNLCLFEHGECITLEKSIRHRVACWTLCDVLTLKHRQKPMSKLDPLFRSSFIKEGYGKLINWRCGICGSSTKLVGVNDCLFHIRFGTLGGGRCSLHRTKL